MSSRDPIPTIRQRLSSARIELALAGIVRGVSMALWQWLLLALLVVVVDAIWPTAPLVRLILAAALAAGLLRILWCCLPPRSLRRASPGRLAREIEQRCNLLHNPLITAVQLQSAPAVSGPADVNELLRHRSAQRGEVAALATGSTSLADRRSRFALLGAIVFALTTGLVAPRPIAAVARRVVDPFGDHPPYTSLTFDIAFTPEAGEIVYGDNASVRVRIGDAWGGSVDRADLVSRIDAVASARPTRLAMQPEPFDQSVDSAPSFSATRRDFREPVRVMIDTPRGRSEWISITPRREPRWLARTATIAGPKYALSQPPRRLPLADRTQPVRVLQGSRISVNATSTLPLRDMLVSGVDSQQSTLSDDHLDAAWNWIANAIGLHEFDLTLVGPTGLHSTATHLIIDVQPDAPPVTSIRQPASDAAALPDQPFRAAIEALDDVSIGDMNVTARVARKGAIVAHADLPVTAITTAADRAMASVDVDLSQFDLQPGDTVQIRATARDQRPDSLGGPQTSKVAQSNILIIDEKTYAALAGQQADAGESSEDGQGEPTAGEDKSQDGQTGSESANGQANGHAPGESGVQLAGGDGSSKVADGAPQGGANPSGAPGDPSGQGTAPAPNGASASAPGGDGQSTSGTPGSDDLLAQAQARSLIQRDGSVQPASGRTDPNGPRRHLTTLDDASHPPAIADSRATTRVQEGASGDADRSPAGIPRRYRDLAARYFKRLAESQGAPSKQGEVGP